MKKITFNNSSYKSRILKDAKDITAEKDNYERWGFYQVINSKDDPEKTFDEVLTDYKTQRVEILDKIDNVYITDLERCNNYIKTIEEDIQKQKVRLQTYEDNIETYVEEQKNIEAEIQSLETRLNEYVEKLGKKKADLIKIRIKEVKEELEELTKTFKDITQQKYDINKRTFDENKDALLEEAKLFKKMANYYEEAYDRVQENITRLYNKGVTLGIAKFFLATGVSATAISGWFFSIFSSKKELNSDGWLFFILNSLMEFGNGIKDDEPFKRWQWLLILIISLITLLAVIGLVAWICQKLMTTSLKKDEGYHNLKVQANWEDAIQFDKKIKGNSFYDMWLQLLPYFLIFGIIYIVIQSGSDIKSLKQLDKSLSGQLTGSILSLMIGGLIYAYIINIIVPRFRTKSKESYQKEKALQTPMSMLLKNIEVVLLFVALIITFIIMFINNEPGTIALLGFVITSIITGFLLGIGLRYKGLLTTRNNIEYDLMWFQNQIKYRNRPIPLFLTSSENRLFKQKYLTLQRELMKLLILKTKSIRNVWQAPSIIARGKAYKLYNKLANIIKKQDNRNKPYLSIYEDIIFPEEKSLIENLQGQLRSKDEDHTELEKIITSIREERSEYQKDKKKIMKNLMEDIDERRMDISQRTDLYRLQIRDYQEETQYQETALHAGYDLAKWFIQNSLN
ncbi:hypothetical protein [uncultured Kordia sp.]|uniref:hypothetical protein n=1 Tax=uncultured Kordia sp. TaxID=507699 RepID=UPI002626AEC1|nr:hypothetical protein [uncultured Kordia sp.]